MVPRPDDGRSRGSVRHQQTSTEELRAPGAWWSSLRAFGPPLASQRTGPEWASRGTTPGGEIPRYGQQVGGIKSEWWAASFRNGGRHHLGTVGGFISEWWATSNRNRGRLRSEPAPSADRH